MKRSKVFPVMIVFALFAGACRSAAPRSADASRREGGSPPVTAGTVLPDRFGAGWAPLGPEKFFTGKDLYNRINGAAELFLEMGFRRLTVQRYGRGEVAIDLEVHEMENSTAALGLYFHKRGPETPLEGLNGRHTGNRFQITACQGRYFFQVNNFGGDRDLVPAMTELARCVFEAIPEGEPVALLAVVPQRGLVAGSELIVRGPHSLQTLCYLGEGDVLQLGGRIFGIAGDYVTGEGGRFTRLVIPYNEPGAAAVAYRNLRTHLDPYLAVIRADEGELVFRDPAKKCGQVKIADNCLELSLHLSCESVSSPR